jgi:outer membrane protein TolC
MLGLIARRVEAGMLSARDLGVERMAVAQLELLRDQEAANRQRALGGLASALSVPLDVVGVMKLRLDSAPPVALDAGVLRGLALRNRLDVHRRLLEFGAADAEVKFAVAAQNPAFVFGPGYAWDQGDNVWSLALGISVPPAAQARAAIREAQARRELAAQQFVATQTDAIALTERAAAQYRAALERLSGAEQRLQLQQEQEARIARQFDTGSADRLQRVAARIGTFASQAAMHAAQADLRQALAQLEDAVQRPLFGDFDALPDMHASHSSGVSKQ